MKSLPRLFAALVVVLFAVVVLNGCSGRQTNSTPTLTSIAVTPATPAHLKVGATQQFTATGTFSDNSTQDISATVTWSSATTASATISNTGLATGVAAGTSAITASQAGVTSSPTVTLTVIALQSIAITPNPASVAISGTVQLTATGTYTDASTSDISSQVTWSCAPSAAATISATGLVTAGAANATCQISATLGSISAPTVTLTVGTGGAPVPVAVKIVQLNPTIAVGSVEDFAAKFLLSDGTLVDPTAAVTWSSGTAATATIIANAGIASGLAAGTSTITAASTGLTSGTSLLTVVAAVPRFAYTVSLENGATAGYAVNATGGTLSFLPGFALGNAPPSQLVFEPSGQFVYAPASIGIAIEKFDPVAGTMAPAGFLAEPISTFNGSTSITQSAVDPTGRFLYVLDSGNTAVNSYSIDTSNTASKGSLTATCTSATCPLTGAAPNGIAVDPLGRFVYVTNSDATISGYTIGANGSLTAMPIGTGPFTSLTLPQFPAIDPLGQFLFVPDIGDSVSGFKIAANGTLTFINSAPAAANAQPFQAAVDPGGKFLYVTNPGTGTVASIPITAGTGVLGAVTVTNTGLGAASFPFGLAVDPTGTLLAVLNNGDNTIALFSVANGVLTPKFVAETSLNVEFVSFFPGTAAPIVGPGNVFAANSGSGNISGFTAVNTTGVLAAGAGSPTAGIAGNSILAADISGKFLFNSKPAGTQFGAFNVTSSTAALSVFSGAPFNLSTNTDNLSGIVTEPTSQFIFVADTTGAQVESFLIGNPPTSQGTSGDLTSVNTVVGDAQGTMLYALGSGVITPVEVDRFTRALSPGLPVSLTGNWVSGAIDPSGHFLVALDATGKALQSFGITPVVQFSDSTPDGDLTTLGSLATGVTAPSSVTFDPLGRFVFVSDATNGTVTAFAFNSSTGAVTTTGKVTTVSATGTGSTSIDASGTYLYAAVKGNGGSTPSAVATYKINADGSLTAVGTPIAAGASTSGTSSVVVTSTVN